MMGAALFEGWGFPANSRKAHYFRESEARSICGKWMYFGTRELPDLPSDDDCAECVRRVRTSHNDRPETLR